MIPEIILTAATPAPCPAFPGFILQVGAKGMDPARILQPM